MPSQMQQGRANMQPEILPCCCSFCSSCVLWTPTTSSIFYFLSLFLGVRQHSRRGLGCLSQAHSARWQGASACSMGRGLVVHTVYNKGRHQIARTAGVWHMQQGRIGLPTQHAQLGGGAMLLALCMRQTNLHGREEPQGSHLYLLQPPRTAGLVMCGPQLLGSWTFVQQRSLQGRSQFSTPLLIYLLVWFTPLKSAGLFTEVVKHITQSQDLGLSVTYWM